MKSPEWKASVSLIFIDLFSCNVDMAFTCEYFMSYTFSDDTNLLVFFITNQLTAMAHIRPKASKYPGST